MPEKATSLNIKNWLYTISWFGSTRNRTPVLGDGHQDIVINAYLVKFYLLEMKCSVVPFSKYKAYQ